MRRMDYALVADITHDYVVDATRALREAGVEDWRRFQRRERAVPPGDREAYIALMIECRSVMHAHG